MEAGETEEGRQQVEEEGEEEAKSGEEERGEDKEGQCNVPLLLLLHIKWTLRSFLHLLLWHPAPFSLLLPSFLPLSFLPILYSLPLPFSYPSPSSCPSLSQFLSLFPSPCLASVVDMARQTLQQWMRKRQNHSHW